MTNQLIEQKHTIIKCGLRANLIQKTCKSGRQPGAMSRGGPISNSNFMEDGILHTKSGSRQLAREGPDLRGAISELHN